MLKKKTLIKMAVALILLCTPCSRAYALKIYITAPKLEEQVLESGRDFYVIGRIDREGRKASDSPIDIKVEVVLTGDARDGKMKPVRSVQSRVDKKTGVTPMRDILLKYDGKAPHVKLTDEELLKSPPPDLVYHSETPESFYDPRVKAVVTENSFAVLIQGGCTKSFDSSYKEIYEKDLEWGLYRVLLTVISGDTTLSEHDVSLNSHSFDIMFGSVQEKILARFSPIQHVKKVEKFVEKRGIRMYRDPFPGYWSIGLPSAYEIPLRWRENDGLEYVSGKIHAILYNIAQEKCATQSVEIGRIAFEGFLNSDEVLYYYYDIGEPLLNIKTPSGIKSIEGEIIPFGYEKKIRFTRAEFNNKSTYNPADVIDVVDTNVYNSVAVNRGEDFVVNGVVTPIQPLLSEVEPNSDGTFSVNSRISYLHYDFVNMIEGTLHSENKPVLLQRTFEENNTKLTEESIYEFRHAFRFPQKMDGKIVTVIVKGYDVKGDEVAGTEEKFYLRVR